MRISSQILSASPDLDRQKGFLKNLMQIYSAKKLNISDYCFFTSLTYLLKSAEIADQFMEKDQF